MKKKPKGHLKIIFKSPINSQPHEKYESEIKFHSCDFQVII